MSARLFHLDVDGDDLGETTLGAFLDLNHESTGGCLGDEAVRAIDALDVGGSYSEGGGAAPLWTLTRIR